MKMKLSLATRLVGFVLAASQMAYAKDISSTQRYLVSFKSEQGFVAMSQVMKTQARSIGSFEMQKALQHVHAIVLKVDAEANGEPKSIASLRLHPEVAAVEKEYFVPAPKPINGFKLARVSPAQFMVGEASGAAVLSANGGIPVFQAGDETPWGIVAVHAGDAWKDASAGSKARVLVLDTGIDANHPAIAPNFERGRNFVQDSTTGKVDPADYADKEGHGTHCSGTILGAYNEATGFTGVAPKAKLLMGRVCSEEGCSSIAIIDGINWGIQQGVDVISMSLGGPVGSSGESSAVRSADRAGIAVVAASGNSATDPNYSPDRRNPNCRKMDADGNLPSCGVSYPAAFPSVIAVGSLTSALERSAFSQWGPELDVTAPGSAVVSSVPVGSGRVSTMSLLLADGQVKEIKSAAFSGTELFLNPVANQLVAVPGLGRTEDFAKVNVAGKFALVSRGEIRFVEKVKNAIAAKAAGVVIYNNTSGLMQGTVAAEDQPLVAIPVVMIEQTVGQALVDQLKSGVNASAEISLSASDYASFDGTSMATPHVAGVVALMKSANKKITTEQIRQILVKTSRPLSPNSTNQFGAGIVQADKAVQAALLAQ